MDTKALAFLTLAVLCAFPSCYGEGASDPIPQCQKDEPADRKACFQGLQLATMPQNVDQVHPLYSTLETSFTMMDPTVHCTDPDKYRQAARCAVNVSRLCHDPDGSRDIIMNADDVVAGMQVLCDKRQEVVIDCFKNFYVMVDECKQYQLRVQGSPSSVCETEDLGYDCMEVIMKPMCGANTTHVFLQQLDRYTVVPSCANGSRPSRQRQRYFPSLLPKPCPPGNDNNEGGHPRPLALLTLLSIAAACVVAAVLG